MNQASENYESSEKTQGSRVGKMADQKTTDNGKGNTTNQEQSGVATSAAEGRVAKDGDRQVRSPLSGVQTSLTHVAGSWSSVIADPPNTPELRANYL